MTAEQAEWYRYLRDNLVAALKESLKKGGKSLRTESGPGYPWPKNEQQAESPKKQANPGLSHKVFHKNCG